ncbi:hypothetical protein NDU88_001827 [Pleurodeles waltl]|uniref:Uncharacterized protein n=1 Tax=Pleurodeles waltl TaxID=8319 RepID=A0AAV7TIX9_PLEWA|nr:hypothetical protein NDU88_001827 [Pleurodeles waltl]
MGRAAMRKEGSSEEESFTFDRFQWSAREDIHDLIVKTQSDTVMNGRGERVDREEELRTSALEMREEAKEAVIPEGGEVATAWNFQFTAHVLSFSVWTVDTALVSVAGSLVCFSADFYRMLGLVYVFSTNARRACRLRLLRRLLPSEKERRAGGCGWARQTRGLR